MGRRHGYDSSPGPYCLGAEDVQELRPPGIADALGEVVILDHVGRLQSLMIDRIVGTYQLKRRLMTEISPLALHFLMGLR